MLTSRSRRRGGSSAWQLRKDPSLQITRMSLVCSCFYYCSPGKLSLCNQVLSSEATNTAQRDAHRAAARQGLPQPSKFILLPLQVGSSGWKLKTISAIFFPQQGEKRARLLIAEPEARADSEQSPCF